MASFTHDPDNEVYCAHEGCGRRIVPTEVPGSWAHWPTTDSAISVIGVVGGRHAALPPEAV